MRRFAPLSLVLLTGLSAACRKSAPAAPEPGALELCEAGLSAIAGGSGEGDSFPAFVAACAGLQAPGVCRDAWTEAKALPAEARRRHVARRCAVASCAGLPEPRPALCREDVQRLSNEAISAGWPELYGALLHRDHPEVRATRLIGLLVALQEEARTAPTTLQIRPQPEGGWLMQIDRERPTAQSVPLEPEVVATLTTELARRAGGAGVVLRVQEGLPKRELAPLLQALSARGVTGAAVEWVPAPD